MRTRFQLRTSAAYVATGLTAFSAAYGIWVAAVYEGVSYALLPFALIAGVGAVLAVIGLRTKRPLLLSLGMLLQLFSPSGFVWAVSVAIALLGAVLLVTTLRHQAPQG